MDRTAIKVYRACILAALAFIAPASYCAEFFTRATPTGNLCFLSGPLKNGDELALRSLLSKRCRQLGLNSLGGSVDVALKMGRIIRSTATNVVIGSEGECVSACVFLYAGGVTRGPYGRVKIHRPYLQTAETSFAATQQRYVRVEIDVKKFLREMNVKEELFDRMMRIEPEDAEALTLDYMESIGMGETDPVYAEFLDNQRAQERGFGKQEWLARKKHAKDQCGNIDGVMMPEKHQRISACWRTVFPEYL